MPLGRERKVMGRRTKGLALLMAALLGLTSIFSLGISPTASLAVKEEASTASPYTYETLGDANGDGQITAADASLILRASVGLESLDGVASTRADVNQDGDAGAADAAKILRYAVSLSDLPEVVASTNLVAQDDGSGRASSYYLADSATTYRYFPATFYN